MAGTWIRALIQFASLYSYRIPNTSPSFAPASPVPSPSAVRLALVDAAIQTSGSVQDGRAVFELVKTAPLLLIPPRKVCVLRVFTKRLKPGKSDELVESTGMREYCHPEGELEAYLQVETEIEHVVQLFRSLRRLGTSDSLAQCEARVGENPDPSLVCRRLADVPMDLSNFDRHMVVSLHDLPDNMGFEAITPYVPSQRGFQYRQDFWVLPLVQKERGENWRIYERVPFNLSFHR